jgi:superfamily II DNA helicase RecQ
VLLWRGGDAELHRKQLDVTFPPPRLLERIWAGAKGRVGVPDNVLDAAERLRRELRPERGPVDWRPVVERRRQAAARIQAVADYARASGCRRSRLVGYFGENLIGCAGCDRCGQKPGSVNVDRKVWARLSRLRLALARSKTLWGGCPPEPDVLLRLAQSPPPSAAALADVPGVGPALAQRLGGAILGALASAYPDHAAESSSPLVEALDRWRARVAQDMGVPRYVVLTDSALHAIAETRPRSREDLARIRGVGPRILAKFGADLLALLRPIKAPQALGLEMDQVVPSG